jgi:hypothetical protein
MVSGKSNEDLRGTVAVAQREPKDLTEYPFEETLTCDAFSCV